MEEAPKYQCGSACPVASKFGVAAIRTIHSNVANFMEEEMNRLDATSSEQSSMWLGAISDAISKGVKPINTDWKKNFGHENNRQHGGLGKPCRLGTIALR